MWSDECSFDTSRGTTKWVIRTKGERYHPACCESVFKSNSKSIPIWGAIGYNWKSPLVFLEGHGKGGGITMEDYKKQVLEAVVRPAFARQIGWDVEGLFQEDNASIHGAGRAGSLKKWKLEQSIHLCDWPPSSPDLAPIENVWRFLKQRIHRRKQPPRTRADLIQAIKDEWDRSEPKEWRKYVDSMPTRLRGFSLRHTISGYTQLSVLNPQSKH